MRDDFLRIVGCIVLGLVIVIGVLAAFQMLSVSPLWSEQGAAWVQAVGSIAAIAVALFLSESGFRKTIALEARKSCETEIRRLRLVQALIHIAAEDIATLYRADDGRDYDFLCAYDPGSLGDCRVPLEELPKLEIPDSEVVFSIVRLCRHMKMVESILRIAESAAQGEFEAKLYAHDFSERIYNLHEYSGLAQTNVRSAIDSRGG